MEYPQNAIPMEYPQETSNAIATISAEAEELATQAAELSDSLDSKTVAECYQDLDDLKGRAFKLQTAVASIMETVGEMPVKDEVEAEA